MTENRSWPDDEDAAPWEHGGSLRRAAAYCAMGDSFFRHALDASLSADQRVDYASDAACMYMLGGVGPVPTASMSLRGLQPGECTDVRLARLISFVEQCRKAALLA